MSALNCVCYNSLLEEMQGLEEQVVPGSWVVKSVEGMARGGA